MADGGKLAVVMHREMDVGITDVWELVIAGEMVDVAWDDEGRAELQATADRINAAVEAEVGRRLDEITKGVA